MDQSMANIQVPPVNQQPVGQPATVGKSLTIQQLLDETIQQKSSDLHLIYGSPPFLRLDGRLTPLPQYGSLTKEVLEQLVFGLFNPEQKDLFLANKELDFSYAYKDVRFRVNAYHQKGTLAGALRLIPGRVSSIDDLQLPKICHTFAQLRQGLVLVTGPTGHGKSTTLASIINEINTTRREHIVTIEDPVEYVYTPAQSIISQREMHLDTHSWDVALRSVLREDPDIVLVGEMRDYETIAAALTIAETGHLVFATLHTNSASQTIDRIVDVFPENQQPQVRLQLAAVLEAVFSQRLVPAIGQGRVPAAEILLATSAIKTTVREGKTHLIDNILQTSGDVGMMLIETSLATLIRNGTITLETGQEFAFRPEELLRLVKK